MRLKFFLKVIIKPLLPIYVLECCSREAPKNVFMNNALEEKRFRLLSLWRSTYFWMKTLRRFQFKYPFKEKEGKNRVSEIMDARRVFECLLRKE
ncbi:hypothetical protein CEXT_316271 [Caerostris extrusa]|uniref:Secreted protein n=1 Tax=Caerostris extrusa TaxID=172846 RepID=A0AAV4QGM4_CAEEX|nr:hypothetical protein CEXT_316271 [Caerostris extrusa]